MCAPLAIFIAVGAVGCGIPQNVSWLHRDEIGQQIVLIAPLYRCVPLNRASPNGPTTRVLSLPAGTRARTIAAYSRDDFLQHERWIEANTIGPAPTKRILVNDQWVALPEHLPEWLDLDAPVPARVASVATLQDALGGPDLPLAAFAAVELTRRGLAVDEPDRLTSLAALVAAVRSNSTTRLDVVERALAGRSVEDRLALASTFESAIEAIEASETPNDDGLGFHARMLRYLLRSQRTQPTSRLPTRE